ncbi:MAG: RusA family crossover junction endodeoxyribonuclease [Acidobacteriota bacterium]|nr:RusA family crossover junction endodeoxyribonuclease [Acidobacteriota bacterium]MDQ6892241.1 RusA family crossover junction endodeoxyribonuclease [Acidobacteriota bacterium]
MKGFQLRPGGVSLFVACVPPRATHQAKKIASRGLRRTPSGTLVPVYGLTDKPELAGARELLAGLFSGRGMAPAKPLVGDVSLIVEYEWPWLKEHDKGKFRAFRARGRMPCRSKPDCSNLAKTIEDVLVALGYMGNDVDVVELTVRKWFGDRPGITVRISTLEPDPFPVTRL